MTLDDRLATSFRELGVATTAPLGVACSGGADSIALLHLCAALDMRVVALHVDHALRDDSAADAAFVTARASELGVDCDVERLALDIATGASIEAVARDARYAALARMADAAGVDLVATAHTLEDQAETVLLRAMRGSTLDAIAPSRGRFVRPLLGIGRGELRAWLAARGITWREDASNDDVRFDRNWVRHEVLPAMRERRAGVDAALARVAARASQDAAALDALALELFEQARVDDIGVLVDRASLELAPAAIAYRVVRLAIRHAGTDPSTGDVERVLAMRGSRLQVGSVDVWQLGDGIAFIAQPALTPDAVVLPAQGTVDDVQRRVRLRAGPSDAEPWRWRSPLPDESPLRIRARADGDRVATPGGTRKVSDVLIDAKIPRPLRDLVGVIAGDRGALAVVGLERCTHGASSGRVVDVEPFAERRGQELGWARELLWNA